MQNDTEQRQIGGAPAAQLGRQAKPRFTAHQLSGAREVRLLGGAVRFAENDPDLNQPPAPEVA